MRRRKIEEELPTLRVDITRLMELAYPGDVSAMSQMMAAIIFSRCLMNRSLN